MENRLASDLDHILAHTEGLWDELRGQHLFITGGTGFFGCWLLESFAWANDRLRLNASALVLTRNPEAFQKKAPHLASHPAIRFHKGDVRDFEFPAGSFSHVIHAASETSAQLNEESLLTLFDTILQGTRHTLEFARSCGAKKILFTSSGAVYGKQPPEMMHVPEDYQGGPDPTDPHSAYGEGKRAAELLCTLYANQYGLETKIARCFAFVGPYLPVDTHFAIGDFIRDGLRGGPIRVHGGGNPFRSYLYAADLVTWLWTILFRGESCRPYNVGSQEEISILHLAGVVADLFASKPVVEVIGKAVPGKISERYVPSVQRAMSELRVQQTIDLSQAVQKTIAQRVFPSENCANINQIFSGRPTEEETVN